MCYEFAHRCNDRIIDKIGGIGALNYFLVCIGDLNYLFTNSALAVEKIRVLLFVEQVALHIISEDELHEILLVPETIACQKFNGNKDVYLQFIKRNRAA
jgi:hypothetical protein